MSFEVVITPDFTKEAKSLIKKYKSLKMNYPVLFLLWKKTQHKALLLEITAIKYALPIASKGKGKSGGARI